MNAFSRISRCLLGTRDFQTAVLTWTHFLPVRAIGTSRYIGVCWDVKPAKWKSQIRLAGRLTHLGYVTDEAEAALAFDRALRAAKPNVQRLQRSLNFPIAEEQSLVADPTATRERNKTLYGSSCLTEARSFNMFKGLLEASTSDSAFDIRRLGEGTTADAVFRPVGHVDDWVGLQLKATQTQHGNAYKFGGTSGYNGLVLACLSLDANLCWIIPGDEVNVTTIAITIGGKWDAPYRCANISAALSSAWLDVQRYPRRSILDWSTPTSANQQIEYRSRQRLTALLCSAGLLVEHPPVHHGQVDFIVDGRVRVQEKTRTVMRSNLQGSYSVGLFKHAGRLQHAGKVKPTVEPYSRDDFDILVVCLWEATEFLGFAAFPTLELCRRGYLDGNRRSMMVYPPWSSPTTRKGNESKSWQEKFFVACSDAHDSSRLQGLFHGHTS